MFCEERGRPGERIVRSVSEVSAMAYESHAVALTDRINALAAALRAAGVPPEQSTSLLASAANATMHALTLDALLEEQSTAVTAPKPARAAVDRPTVPRLPLAA
jgi:hypothetical protein